MDGAAGYMLCAAGYVVGTTSDFSVSPSPFGLDFGTSDFGLGLDKLTRVVKKQVLNKKNE